MVRVRLIGKDGAVLTEAEVQSWRNDDPRDGMGRTGHVHASLPVGATMPFWHGGTYTIDDSTWMRTGLRNIYFSLPSGHENIWGQGNDFDVDTVRIHPDDLALFPPGGRST